MLSGSLGLASDHFGAHWFRRVHSGSREFTRSLRGIAEFIPVSEDSFRRVGVVGLIWVRVSKLGRA